MHVHATQKTQHKLKSLNSEVKDQTPFSILQQQSHQ